MCVCVFQFVADVHSFISKQTDSICFWWSSLSFWICRWRRLSFWCCLSIENIEVSLFFLFQNLSDRSNSFLGTKVRRSKNSSSLIIKFFNSGRISFLTFPFLMSVSGAFKNRLCKRFLSWGQSFSLAGLRTYQSCNKINTCLIHWRSVKVDLESFSL